MKIVVAITTAATIGRATSVADSAATTVLSKAAMVVGNAIPMAASLTTMTIDVAMVANTVGATIKAAFRMKMIGAVIEETGSAEAGMTAATTRAQAVATTIATTIATWKIEARAAGGLATRKLTPALHSSAEETRAVVAVATSMMTIVGAVRVETRIIVGGLATPEVTRRPRGADGSIAVDPRLTH